MVEIHTVKQVQKDSKEIAADAANDI